MQVEYTHLEGLKLIHLKKIVDVRGGFVKVFNDDFFKENKLDTAIKESYFSISKKNVIRGMHFQTPPFEHTKLVFVNNGSIIDVVLDIRKDSKSYGSFFSRTITSEEPVVVYIPVGFAHGFLSLEDNTIVSYIQTSVYNKNCDAGVKWSSFGMNWGCENPIISERDSLFDDFVNFKTPF